MKPLHSTHFRSRLSTKEQFLLRRKSKQQGTDKTIPWYRQRSNYLVLLMLFVIALFMVGIKAYYQLVPHPANSAVRNLSESPEESTNTSDPNELDYENAKRIFRGLP